MTAELTSRRRRRTSGGRLARTIVLAAAALVAVLYGLQQYLDLDTAELWSYAQLSLLWLLLPLAAAVLGFGALLAMRLLFRSLRGTEED